MHVQFENRQRKFPVTELEPVIESLFEQAMMDDKLNHNFVQKQLIPIVTVSFVSAAFMRKTNLETRQIDKVTDVLSFPMLDMTDGKLNQKITSTDTDWTDYGQPSVFLGDILISLERAAKQAIDYNHGFNRETGFLAVHGLLHLLGYDHDTIEREKKMQKNQRKILDTVGLSR